MRADLGNARRQQMVAAACASAGLLLALISFTLWLGVPGFLAARAGWLLVCMFGFALGFVLYNAVVFFHRALR